VQMSTTHSSFDQYCISHKTISHRAAAAAGPEVRRECPKTKFTALTLLATNPGDATGWACFLVTALRTENFVSVHVTYSQRIARPWTTATADITSRLNKDRHHTHLPTS